MTHIQINVHESDETDVEAMAFVGGLEFLSVKLRINDTLVSFLVNHTTVEKFGMLLEKLRREYDLEARKLRKGGEEKREARP